MASLIRTPHAWTDARLRAAAGLITAALVIGCGDDTTGDATSDSATTNSSATGMTTDTTAGTSSGDTSGGPGGSETAGMTSSTSGATATDATTSGASETDPNSTGVTTGVTTVETTDGTGEPTTGDATTGGGGQCGVADGDYGPCDAIIGWAFTGTTCELLSGCDCGDDCDLFFDNEIDCAKTCADAGECDEDKLFGVALADDLTLGGFCDQVDVCTPQQYSQLLPDLFPEQFVCEPGQFCPNQQETCTVSWAGEVTEELWTQLCAASLLPGLSTINCVIWGP